MDFPVDIKVGHFVLSSHLVFEVLAYVCGFRYYLFLRKRIHDPISEEHRFSILVGAALGALIGSRLLGYLSISDQALTSFETWIAILSSKSILGALLGGLIGVEITKKVIGINRSSGDLFTYPLILAIIIGRIGCFLAGVQDGTHGVPSHLPWAIDMGDGIPRHPAQLYEILFLVILWLTLYALNDRLPEGGRFKLFMIGYLLFRLLIEFIKPVYRYPIGLSSIQIAAILGLLYYFPFIIQAITSPKSGGKT